MLSFVPPLRPPVEFRRWRVLKSLIEQEVTKTTDHCHRSSKGNNFGNWCIGKRGKCKRSRFNGEKRLQSNPFQGMFRMDERADRRRKARALSEDEFVRLLTAIRQRPLSDALTIRRGKDKSNLLAKISDERMADLDSRKSGSVPSRSAAW